MIDYAQFWDDQLSDPSNPIGVVKNVRVVGEEVLYDFVPLEKATEEQ